MTTTTNQPANFSTVEWDERVKQMHAGLHDAIKAITSTDDWAEWLSLAARFWNYSFNNLVLMHIQHPGFTYVGGEKNCWWKFDRRLIEGEYYHPIWILAPRMVKTTAAEQARTPGIGERKCIGFRAVRVYDVSQTEGKPMPVQPEGAKVEHLNGQAPVGLYQDLIAMIKAEGFTFELGAMPSGWESANGVTDFAHMKVTIKVGMSQAQTVKTTAHELAHILLHKPKDWLNSGSCREDAEVEAESVAYIVLKAHDVATDGYSFGYIVNWASRSGADAVVKTGERVMRASKKILTKSLPQD